MKKIEAHRVTCHKCKLISYTIVPEVYGTCPYCRKVVHWKNKEKLFGKTEKKAV